MAGTVTKTEERKINGFLKVQWDWLSTAGGVADLITTEVYSGIVYEAVFEPDAGGTQPTDLYDITVEDGDGYDILMGNGADLSNAATVYKHVATDGLGACYNSKLTLNVAAGGNAKGGKVTLFIG